MTDAEREALLEQSGHVVAVPAGDAFALTLAPDGKGFHWWRRAEDGGFEPARDGEVSHYARLEAVAAMPEAHRRYRELRYPRAGAAEGS